MRPLVLILLALVAFGCQSGNASPAVDATSNSTSSKLREGSFSLGQTIDAIADSLTLVREYETLAKGVDKQAYTDIADFLDSAGETLGDVSKPFEESDPEVEKKRKAVIEAEKDAFVDLQEAAGIAESLDPSNKRVVSAIEVALDALQASVEAFGGKVEETAEPQ